MKIEIRGETPEFKVEEYIIRDLDWDVDGEKSIKKPHLQAKISLSGDARDNNYDCDISYYDQEGKFVGLDETNFYYQRKVENTPSAFSTALNIPESSAKMVVTFSTEKESEFKQYAVGFAVVSGLVLLAAVAVKVILSIFQ
jgi:hypothetical protein